MGVTLEFRAGNKSRIADAVRGIDLDVLDNPNVTKFNANFSLHINPRDLDLLSEAIGESCSKQILQLRPFLTAIVDEVDRGALSICATWVAYVAAADLAKVQSISKRWAEKVAEEYPDEDIQLTTSMTEAVGSLLNLCKRAIAERIDVVHVWFL